MEIAVVAVTEKIEFEAFGLHHLHVRDIGNAYFGKIRLPRNRTQAGEFRAIELHPIVIVLMPVYECLQDRRVIVLTVFCLCAESLQALHFSSFCHIIYQIL